MSRERDRDLVTSAQNPRIKAAAALRDRKARDAEGKLLVEGAREIGRALASGWEADAAFVCPDLLSRDATSLLSALGTPRVTDVTPHVFDKLALREGSDGLAVVFLARARTLDEVVAPLSAAASSPPPLVVALHGIEKPGNVGAILRSADGAGASGVVLLEGSGDPWSPNAVRASLGACFAVPIAQSTSDELVHLAGARGVRLVAAALTPDARPPWDVDVTGPTCLVLGAESVGLPAPWLARASATVAIPMRGIADSLNVSAAAAMLLYEAMRQRAAPPPTPPAAAAGGRT